MSKELSRLEIASRSECKIACTRDSETMATQEKRKGFVASNEFAYYIVINTWLMMIEQWCGFGYIDVLRYITEHGLCETIRAFDKSAMNLIRGERLDFSLARSLWYSIQNYIPVRGAFDANANIHFSPIAVALQLFRYPKRISPVAADAVKKESIDSFIQRQKELRSLQATPELWSPMVLRTVKEEVCEIFNWEEASHEVKSALEERDFIFTSGVSLECGADLASKLQSVLRREPEYFVQPFGIPLVSLPEPEDHGPNDELPQPYWGKPLHRSEVHTVRIAAVPKNYKTARIIAPELTTRQGLARRLFKVLDRWTPEGIPLHDQGMNQQLAKEGSETGRLATIDLSSASDRITWTLLGSILPPDMVDVARQVLPTHYVLSYDDANRSILQSAATMGNSLTFWLESLVFYAITRAAVKYYNLLTGEVDLTVSVYGDDIICPTNAAPTVIDWLEKCGFVVNDDKSFYSPSLRYRESCGEEYLEGVALTSYYFPRFPIEGSFDKNGNCQAKPGGFRDAYTDMAVSTMTMLLDLQHKMFRICDRASRFMTEVIYECDPSMTSSTWEQGFQDLWSWESKPRNRLLGKEEITDDTGEVINLRSGHKSASWVHRKVKDPEKGTRLYYLWKLYCYRRFLKDGPQYEDWLDRQDGISLPPLTFAQFSKRGEVAWTMVTEP